MSSSQAEQESSRYLSAKYNIAMHKDTSPQYIAAKFMLIYYDIYIYIL